jgi:hypothetical protein
MKLLFPVTGSFAGFSLITIFGVLSYFTPDDWPGKNHTGEITDHTGEIIQLFHLYDFSDNLIYLFNHAFH